MSKEKTYLTTRSVTHDHVEYPEGSKIALGDAHAAPLLTCGAIVAPPARAKSEKLDGEDGGEGGGEGKGEA